MVSASHVELRHFSSQRSCEKHDEAWLSQTPQVEQGEGKNRQFCQDHSEVEGPGGFPSVETASPRAKGFGGVELEVREVGRGGRGRL